MQFDISVIIEWENVLLAEQERCVAMLGQLRQQVLDSRHCIEVLVGFNPEQVDRAIVESAVAGYLSPADAQGRTVACRIVAGTGRHYYQLKNLCIREASGRVIVFLDSDVIPEAGWLHALTEPFWEHADIRVVAGHTYLDPLGLFGRAFALGWFFPLRTDTPALRAGGRRFFANNVAFRRDVIQAHPFPEMADGMTRGACVHLAATLNNENIVIWRQSGAQTSHPAPNGLAHFVARGLVQGRDWAMDRKCMGEPRWRTSLLALRKVLSDCLRMLRRTLRDGHKVGLTMWQAPLAVALMALFYLEGCLGAWAYAVAPQQARLWWRI